MALYGHWGLSVTNDEPGSTTTAPQQSIGGVEQCCCCFHKAKFNFAKPDCNSFLETDATNCFVFTTFYQRKPLFLVVIKRVQ